MSRLDFQRAATARIRNTPNAKLNPEAVSLDGNAINLLVGGMAAIGDELDARSAARQSAGLSTTARDSDLDTVIMEETFGRLPRKAASASELSAVATRPAPATGDAVIPVGTKILAGGLLFTTTQQVVFPAGQVGGRTVFATCAKVGSSSNVAIDDIAWQFPPTDDPTITIAPSSTDNGGFATGGGDREKDSIYLSRRATFGSGLDRNVDVFAAGALTADGIVFATAIEDLGTDGTPTGIVFLYVGDLNGRANEATIARLRAKLRDFRLSGQHVEIVGSVPSLQSIVLSFGILDGFVQDDVQQAAKAAVIAAVNKLAPGQTLSRATIAAAIVSVNGAVLLTSPAFGCTVPSADVVASSAATSFRTSDALVSFA